jgi:hypothetical protein
MNVAVENIRTEKVSGAMDSANTEKSNTFEVQASPCFIRSRMKNKRLKSFLRSKIRTCLKQAYQ